VGYVVGVDFGTLSGRAVVVRVSDGFELASAVHPYSSGVLDATLPDGTPLPPEWALQDPADYLEVLRVAVPGAIAASGIDPGDVVGIGCDFTACTVLPTLADGTPLCDLPEWRSHPHAWVKLWKHHAAQPEADVVNAVAGERGEPWLPRYGSRISSEWLFPKLLQILHEAPEVYRAAERFVEAADWIIWQLTGAETRNACTAGYKAIHQDGRFPTDEYLAALHPEFGDAVDRLMLTDLASLGDCAGHLCEKAAGWTGLRAGIAVAVGNVDAHVTAPAAGAVGPGELVAIMGTSTCHVLNGTALREVPGMCGVVDGGIVPGLYGYEAGQSGVGDIFGWFVDHAVPPEFHREASIAGIGLHELLTREAARQVPGAHGLLALDWWNGNRSVLVDANVSGLVVGATLATRGVRHASDRRELRRPRRRRRPDRARRRAHQEPAAPADLRRRPRPSARHRQQRPRSRPRERHARSSRRWLLSRHHGSSRADGTATTTGGDAEPGCGRRVRQAVHRVCATPRSVRPRR
jgi:L-ribulokinase